MYNRCQPTSISNNKFKTYLIGAMEAPSKNDSGEGWRKTITPQLNMLGVYCFDPTKEETQKVGMPTKELIMKLNQWQENEEWNIYTEYMNKIWRGVSEYTEDEKTHEPKIYHIMGDVDYVEQSDFLTMAYDDGDVLGGTIAELTIAWYRGLPVYLITQCPLKKMNKSILYFILDSGHGKGKIFKTQNEYIHFLSQQYK